MNDFEIIDSSDLANQLSRLNVNNRNKDKTIRFSEQIIHKENKTTIFNNFVSSTSLNGLIYAPTQVGKSDATIEFINTCFYNKIPVIVSTDNKLDQQEQLFNRINTKLLINEKVLLKTGDPQFVKILEKCIKEKCNNFIIFCLDNAAQINKIIKELSTLYLEYDNLDHIKKIAIIHDEADIITKDKNIDNIKREQSLSHQQWIKLHNLINNKMPNITLKRVFVTATPENCVMLYNIDCPDVMRLEITNDYTGYDKIHHISIDDNENLIELVGNEVQRIKNENTFEAILYCIERNIVSGQNVLLKDISINYDCIVNTYNGNGISTYMHNPEQMHAFEKALKRYKIKYEKDDELFQIKTLSIRKFYSIIKSIGENCIITIGKDLICRGISYVGEDDHEPITATTLFYKPGSTMHNVGICQTIGRITGNAMPNLKRRLYTTTDVYTNYVNYNKNQEIYMKNINSSSDNIVTKEIMNTTLFKKITRPLDRPKLNLKIKCESKEENDSEEYIDGVKVSKLKEWISSDLVVGKILKYLYDNNKKMSIKELHNIICPDKSSVDFDSNLHNGRSYKCQYGKLWNVNKDIIHLNENIRKYIDKNC